jgi:hypothetical protein
MKILSAILATLILFLTVQAVLTNSSFISKNTTQTFDKCCADKQNSQSSKSQKQKKQNNDCCNNGRCDNPFLGCANCYFTNPDKETFSVAVIFKQPKKIGLTDDKMLSSFAQDFWHPPNLI